MSVVPEEREGGAGPNVVTTDAQTEVTVDLRGVTREPGADGTSVHTDAGIDGPDTPGPEPDDHAIQRLWSGPLWTGIARSSGRWIAAIAGALVIFSILLISKGADPMTVLGDAILSIVGQPLALQEIVIKAAPFALATLAVVVPARAGLVNVGGEGQVLMGAVAAAGVGLALDNSAPGWLVLILAMLAGAAAGAAWAGLAALLRLFVSVNEAISTLLLNFVALDLLFFLIYEPWKDPNGSGQPATRELADAAQLPLLNGTIINVGVFLAIAAAITVWAVFRYTTWGFRLAVVGGNSEAGRRAGMPVSRLILIAMLAGGALAGLAGFVHFAGVEHELRPGLTTNIGYIGFLASWLIRHRPFAALVAALAFAAIAVAGDSLQIDSGLPAATVSVFTGLVLIAVLGWSQRKVVKS